MPRSCAKRSVLRRAFPRTKNGILPSSFSASDSQTGVAPELAAEALDCPEGSACATGLDCAVGLTT